MNNETQETQYDEKVLSDNYPVFPDYLYVVDGKIVRSDIMGDVRDLKRECNAKEVKNCDIVGRGLMHLMA